MFIIEPGIYEHYKGKRYRVLGMAKIEATEEDVVIYEALYDNELSKTWVRPVESFLEEVEWEGKIVSRFRKVG